jgi:hypothetical protein
LAPGSKFYGEGRSAIAEIAECGDVNFCKDILNGELGEN